MKPPTRKGTNLANRTISRIEEYQMTNNLMELESVFAKAKRTVVQGGTVVLTRENADGSLYNVDEISTEADLQAYRSTIFKYL
jgi:predicted transcriptional regulator